MKQTEFAATRGAEHTAAAGRAADPAQEAAYVEEMLSKVLHDSAERSARLRQSLTPAEFACWLLGHRLARLRLMEALGAPAPLIAPGRRLVNEALAEAVRLLAAAGSR